MKKIIITGMFILTFISLVSAQTKVTSKSVSLEISGTSTMHDWTMKGSGGTCSVDFKFDGSGNIIEVANMSFSVPVSTLKSGKGAMDKNAYKALKSEKNPNITAKFSTGVVSNNGINSKTALSIAGKTLEVPISSVIKTTGNTITVTTEKSIDMTQWGAEPPSFMMGAVKTGKDVTVKITLTFDKPVN
jgi:hypothetical protein